MQLSTIWNNELKTKKSMYPWHKGWNTSWENDFLIVVSSLPGKPFKLVSGNWSKNTGIWMPLDERELIRRKEETLYRRLLNSCFLKAIPATSTTATYVFLAQTKLCRLVKVTWIHRCPLLLHQEKIIVTNVIKSGRKVCPFTKAVWCHTQTSSCACVSCFKTSNVTKSSVNYLCTTCNISCK